MEEILSDIKFTADVMLKNQENLDVIKFYSGKLSILLRELDAVIIAGCKSQNPK